ncbi:hypothetical protein F4824DRAFT_453598 [Ustulina deusta]|nr:hypothetical protein F4824DRAFT_453598 [Ustulina deusta]
MDELAEPDECYSCFGSRCSFCRFELVLKEKIIAVVDNGKISRPFRFGLRKFWDDSLLITFVHCQGECLHFDGKSSVCHVECLEFTAYKSPTKIFHALAYTFEPSAATEKQRRQWIQSSFISNLKLGSRSLPQELALMIAQYCIREYAIAAVSLPIAVPNTYPLDILRGIWACYVIIDGAQYFASFANKSSIDAQLILSIEEAVNVDRIYVGEDHLGIRQVYFGNSTPPKLDRSVSELWWRTFSIHDGAQLHIHTDGLKIRYLESLPGDKISHLAKNIAWLTPENRPDLIRFHSLTSRSPTQLRMTSLVCNDPRTTAYSASWDWPILHLHAHIVGESLAFYNEVVAQRKNALWLYMPRNEGEYISQIWKRSRKLTRELAILIVTNKGRVMMLGPQPQPYWRPCNWTLLHQSDGTSSRIFFDVSPHGIHKLAFESSQPLSQGQFPIVPTPLSPYPESTSLDDYFYTSTMLENVIELIPCKGKVAGRPSIIGLLFRYSDSNQACVGQFRLDCTATPLVVGNSSKMWLSFDTKDGYPFVDSVGVSRPPKPMSRRCLYISWAGRLEWWFSYRQCKVYYQGQTSVATKS